MKFNAKMLLVYFLSVVVIAIWGMSLIWTDELFALSIPPEFILPIRTLLAGLLLLAFNLITRQSMRIQNRKDLYLFCAISLFEPLLYFLAEAYGLKLTASPTVSALILALNPVFALFAGMIVFREKVTWVNVVGLLLTITGLAFVVLKQESFGRYFFIGIIILLFASLSEVAYATLTKRLATGSSARSEGTDRAGKSYSASVIVMWQFLIGCIYLIPLFLTRGLRHYDPAIYLSWDVLRPLICLALLCSCLCFTLWAFCIKYLGVAKSGNFIAITPVFTALICWVIGREFLAVHQWVGIGIALFGLILTQYAGEVRCRRKSSR